MVRKILENFEVPYLQILDETGRLDSKLMPKLSANDIKRMYEFMVLSRIFDDKSLNLQRQGRLGTYASVRGQEAAQVGSAYALSDKDWMFPAFRESAAYIVRGTPLRMIFQYWAGDERGQFYPEKLNNFAVSIPVGSQIPHAVGAGWGAKLKGDKTASLVYFGDGATSEGDFHEALNFAGVFKVPVVFLCQNNQWAISLPREKQTAAKTLAQKAFAYGFEGIQVDGNDIFAVYKATKEALEKAKRGKGPTLIECFTYRIGDHTTADDASRYRNKKEVEVWKKKDPIDRLRKYMNKKKLWTGAYEKKIKSEAEAKVERAVKEMESATSPNPEDIFNFTYKELTHNLTEQKEKLLAFLKGERNG